MSLSVKIPTNEPSFTTRTDPARPVDIARAACVTLTEGSTVISSVLMSSRTVVNPPVTILVSDESAFIPIMPVKSPTGGTQGPAEGWSPTVDAGLSELRRGESGSVSPVRHLRHEARSRDLPVQEVRKTVTIVFSDLKGPASTGPGPGTRGVPARRLPGSALFPGPARH